MGGEVYLYQCIESQAVGKKSQSSLVHIYQGQFKDRGQMNPGRIHEKKSKELKEINSNCLQGKSKEPPLGT